MTDTPVDEPSIGSDQQRLVDFLDRLRGDLDNWTSAEPDGDVRIFATDDFRALARAAFEEGVSGTLEALIQALLRDWALYVPSLRAHGLTDANLLFKTSLADHYRAGALDGSRSGRAMFGSLSRYMDVSSSILGSIKEAFDHLPWWAKFAIELIKEFLDMIGSQARERSEARPLGGGIVF